MQTVLHPTEKPFRNIRRHSQRDAGSESGFLPGSHALLGNPHLPARSDPSVCIPTRRVRVRLSVFLLRLSCFQSVECFSLVPMRCVGTLSFQHVQTHPYAFPRGAWERVRGLSGNPHLPDHSDPAYAFPRGAWERVMSHQERSIPTMRGVIRNKRTCLFFNFLSDLKSAPTTGMSAKTGILERSSVSVSL